MNFEEFFRNCTGATPYAYQRAFAEAATLPDLLEAPTGSGKTATAVLGWLWRRLHGTPEQRAEAGRRLVFCLPMRTLVEQTERVVHDWRRRLGLPPDALGVHVLLGGAIDDTWEEHPDRDAILIGTQDQLLSRALMRGYAMSRFMWPVHFALLHSDCTWIIDEVQLMGVGASTAAQLQAFREHHGVVGNAKTVWMTATLDEDRLRTVDLKRPMMRLPFVAKEPALEKRLRARKQLARATASVVAKGTLAALAKEIASVHEPGTLSLIIVNRVARAQELHARLSELRGKDARVEAVGLVHSRFRPADRRRIQSAVLDGSFQGVLVATQAIEAGVDLSAKALFTELAPWPSLVQRFGRLNRAGEHDQARAFWIDLDHDDEEICLPYDAALLRLSRARLENLTDVGPASLADVPKDHDSPALPVIRRKDLFDLFDTEPDLAGHDIDVSRFIRTTEDRDVHVAWRALEEHPPKDDAPDLHRDELCAVPFYALAKLARNHAIWRFDSLRQRWVDVPADRLFPGLAVVVDVSVGGYDESLGFTGDHTHVPSPCTVPALLPEADSADPWTYGAAEYVSLRMHAEDTAEEMQQLAGHLGSMLHAVAEVDELVAVARWHDAGKAHEVFQQMLVARLPSTDPRRFGGPWAKSDNKLPSRSPRRFFRHELVSALAWLAEDRPDLGAYLVAAHHGKVRMSLRARPGEEPPPGAARRFAHGVHDGDVLPAVDLGGGVTSSELTLSLACMDVGGEVGAPSWIDRTQRLLEKLGPFRLAYLEMLIRVADWRASAKRAVSTSPGVTSHG